MLRTRPGRLGIVVLLVLFLLVPTRPARAIGALDYGVLIWDVAIVNLAVLYLLGPVIGKVFNNIVPGSATTTDTSAVGSLNGPVEGQTLDITLSGGAGTGGTFFLSGSGTLGPDPVLGSLGLLGIVPGVELTVASAFFEAGSNTTTLTFGNVVLSLVPGVTSSYTVDLDIDGAMSSFAVDQTFSNSTPGTIQLQSVAHLGQDVVIDVTQNGSNWLFEASSVPEPSVLMLLALPAVFFATGRFKWRMRNA